MNKPHRILAIGLIVILIMLSVLAVSTSFVDPLLQVKWYSVWLVTLLLLIFLSSLHLLNKEIPLLTYVSGAEFGILAACFILSLLSLYEYLGDTLIDRVFMVGTFDNVAGLSSCLLFSFPVGLIPEYRFRSKIAKTAVWIIKILSVLVLILYKSRIGLIGVCLFLIYFFLKGNRYRRWIISSALVVCVVLATFCLKTDSSKGRWFILQMSLEMVADKPFTGWGYHGFEAHYMDRQADYFVTHADSEYEMLADNIHHPLNEYVKIAVDYGMVGLLTVCIFLYFIVSYYKNNTSEYGRLGMVILALILLMSFFSYPLTYPFTWLMIGFSLILIYHRWIRVKINQSRLGHLVPAYIITISVLLLFHVGTDIRNNLEWGVVADKADHGMAREMLPRYEQLYDAMGDNPMFLYNYTAALLLSGKFKDAIRLGTETDMLVADYDTQILLGDAYRFNNDSYEAIRCYKTAGSMCPSKFMPLYDIYCIYKNIQDTISCKRYSDLILNKRIKKHSAVIDNIRKEVQYDRKNFF